MKKALAGVLLMFSGVAAADDHLVAVVRFAQPGHSPEVAFYDEKYRSPEQCVAALAKFSALRKSVEPPAAAPSVEARCARTTTIFDAMDGALKHTYFVRYAAGALAVTEMTDMPACERHKSMHGALLDTASYCAKSSQAVLYQ